MTFSRAGAGRIDLYSVRRQKRQETFKKSIFPQSKKSLFSVIYLADSPEETDTLECV